MQIVVKDVKISSKLKKQFQDRANKIAKQGAQIAMDQMFDDYVSMITLYYADYSPSKYVRQFGLYGSGIGELTGKRSVFLGGLNISSDIMPDHYQEGPDAALGSMLAGYHGSPAGGIVIRSFNVMQRLAQIQKKAASVAIDALS